MNYSIIIPHYTRTGDVSLLKRAVASIPSRDDIQVIIVDNSPLPIDSMLFSGERRVNLLYSDNKKGAGHARNVGLREAEGKWLLFLDADDFFTENAFDYIDNYVNSQYDIVFFKFCSKYSDTLEPADRDFYFNRYIEEYINTRSEDHMRYDYATPCSKMIRSSLVKHNQIDFEEVHASNDVMFSVKTGYFAKSIHVDTGVVYCATVSHGSLTNEISKQNITDRFEARVRMNLFLKKHGIKPRASVMGYLIASSRYGFYVFLHFLKLSVLSGSIFVGYQRWGRTILRVLNSKSNKQYKLRKK